MATLFKDFGKESKDLLTKNTAEAKGSVKQGFAPLAWKVESKYKNSNEEGKRVVVNPVFEQKTEDEGKVKTEVTTNVEIIEPTTGLKLKFGLQPGPIAGTKPTLTFEQSGRKVEGFVKAFNNPSVFEVTYEDKQKSYAALVKIADEGKDNTGIVISDETSIPVIGNDLTVGGSVAFALSSKSIKTWSVGLRYALNKTTGASLTSEKLQKFAFGAFFDIPQLTVEGKPISGAVTVDFNRAPKPDEASLKVVAGLSGKVPFCPPGSSYKAKVDVLKLNISLSHIVDVKGWKIASTFDISQGAFGVLATCE